jgi:transcriptional regulator GlxA family with amidase domain
VDFVIIGAGQTGRSLSYQFCGGARVRGEQARTCFRVFAREVGMTPGRFVERVRVEAERRLLEETTRGGSDDATTCGFVSQETMGESFRRTLGVSPKRYRSCFSMSVVSDEILQGEQR